MTAAWQTGQSLTQISQSDRMNSISRLKSAHPVALQAASVMQVERGRIVVGKA